LPQNLLLSRQLSADAFCLPFAAPVSVQFFFQSATKVLKLRRNIAPFCPGRNDTDIFFVYIPENSSGGQSFSQNYGLVSQGCFFLWGCFSFAMNCATNIPQCIVQVFL
jgi:hypothetical protein